MFFPTKFLLRRSEAKGSISTPLFYDCFKTIQVVTKQSDQMKISYKTVLFGKVE